MTKVNIFTKKYCNNQKNMLLLYRYGGIGEVVNTVDCGSIIRGFDSHIPSH